MAWEQSDETSSGHPLWVEDADRDGDVRMDIAGRGGKYLSPDEALAFGIEVIVQAVAGARIAERRKAARAAESPKVNYTTASSPEPAWIGEAPPLDLSATLRERIARSEFRTGG